MSTKKASSYRAKGREVLYSPTYQHWRQALKERKFDDARIYSIDHRRQFMRSGSLGNVKGSRS